jgi:uncharacterized protein YqcC (DUF446 family)
MPRDSRERALLAVVESLEAELRRIDLWEPDPPTESLLESSQPFCFDTLGLSQWLQWLLIPRMRSVLAGEIPMPSRSAIYPLAEDSFGHLDDPTPLLTLIERFDHLIGGEVAATLH